MGLDIDIVSQRLALLDDAIAVLKAHRGVTADALEGSLELRWMVQHGLLTCIQAVLDIAGHIVAARGAPTPIDYRSTITALGRLGVVPEELAEQMAPMAGFRNVLVHEYAGVDLKIVSRALNERLGDFSKLVRYVNAYIEESGAGSAAK